eukprot:TRINITY_DN7587_c0_g1_i3.p1 TRINITY_DN7587_c0_g1~~TRINITY_DN7587_c0_g1_i3.p1  ORF type:complete len:516 (+),score=105.74 TRINITY_DN7587_c0_g1_i3:96-1643(+)
MIRRPPRSTLSSSSAASDVYKRQVQLTPLERRRSSRANTPVTTPVPVPAPAPAPAPAPSVAPLERRRSSRANTPVTTPVPAPAPSPSTNHADAAVDACPPKRPDHSELPDDTRRKRTLREVFNSIDADKNGWLDRDEMRAMADEATAQGMPVDEEALDVMFTRMDLNGDGQISFEEFCVGMIPWKAPLAPAPAPVAAHVPAPGPRPALAAAPAADEPRLTRRPKRQECDGSRALREVFNSIDADKNGLLDRDEMRLMVDQATARGVLMDEEALDTMFTRMDLNGDGQISFEEFCSALRTAVSPDRVEAICKSSQLEADLAAILQSATATRPSSGRPASNTASKAIAPRNHSAAARRTAYSKARGSALAGKQPSHHRKHAEPDSVFGDHNRPLLKGRVGGSVPGRDRSKTVASKQLGVDGGSRPRSSSMEAKAVAARALARMQDEQAERNAEDLLVQKHVELQWQEAASTLQLKTEDARALTETEKWMKIEQQARAAELEIMLENSRANVDTFGNY